MKQGFPEVKFTKEFTSFQGNYCSRFDDCLGRVPRWRLASCQQKMMSLQKKGYLVKVSFLSLKALICRHRKQTPRKCWSS